MTTVVISQPMLFPWPGFFEQLSLCDVYVHLDDAQFSKGSFTNRIQIKAGNERQWMTIPLAGKGSFRQIRDLEAASGDWRRSHRDMLRQALKGAPHLADALDIVDAVYHHDGLCDLLMASVDVPAAYLGLAPSRTIMQASALGIGGGSWQRVLDIVRYFGGNRYLTGHGAAHYLDHEAFEAVGVTVEYMDYSKTPWPQFGESFTAYVSILDLIAHQGPRAVDYLRPATRPWRDFIDAGSGPAPSMKIADGIME